MSDAASVAFDHIVALVLSGAMAPAATTPAQAAAERGRLLAEERARLIRCLEAAGVRVSKNICAYELRELAAASGIERLNGQLAVEREIA